MCTCVRYGKENVKSRYAQAVFLYFHSFIDLANETIIRI